MAKDLGKKLDIWKDRTLFDVTEESNLRIIVSPHQKRKKNLKGSLEKKQNVHKNMLNDFPKRTVTYFMCNVKKGFLSPGMTELSKGWKDSNFVLLH